MKRSPLKRGKGLARGQSIARKPSARPRDPEAAKEWHRQVVGPKTRCAVCGASRRLQGHHVVAQQALRRKARELGLDPSILLWDPRNGMALCTRDHERHTTAFCRVPRERLPPAVWEFAREYNLVHRLEREYPCQAPPE